MQKTQSPTHKSEQQYAPNGVLADLKRFRPVHKKFAKIEIRMRRLFREFQADG